MIAFVFQSGKSYEEMKRELGDVALPVDIKPVLTFSKISKHIQKKLCFNIDKSYQNSEFNYLKYELVYSLRPEKKTFL